MKWYYCPTGRYLHIPPLMPDSDWDPSSFSIPWWKDQSLCIGDLSDKTRKIRVINQLTKADDIIEVCSEETMNEILDRYLELNQHADSYTWKRLGRPLDMEKTMEENDIPDDPGPSFRFTGISATENDFKYSNIALNVFTMVRISLPALLPNRCAASRTVELRIALLAKKRPAATHASRFPVAHAKETPLSLTA